MERAMVKAAEREGRRHALSLRVTSKMRSWIEQHASVEGRSITQEVEARLELQAMAEQAFGGSENFRLLLSLAQTIPDIEEAIGVKWYEDNSGICRLRLMKSLGHMMEWQSMMMDQPSDEEHQEVAIEFGLMPTPEPSPAVRLATPEEIAKAVPAENRSPELFNRADFDEARGPNRDGDVTPPVPVEPAPAPTRRKKAKARAAT